MRTATTSSRLNGLSARELEVLHLLAQGLTDRGICDRLVLSPRTVASHIRHLHQARDTRQRPRQPARPRRPGLPQRHHRPATRPDGRIPVRKHHPALTAGKRRCSGGRGRQIRSHDGRNINVGRA
jgi:DNA-binding CsgD family transcriptional regulator